MRRRQFVGASASVTALLLGRNTLNFARRNVAPPPDPLRHRQVHPRSERCEGQFVSTDGTSATVRILSRESRDPVRVTVERKEYPTGETLASRTSDRIQFQGPGQPEVLEVQVPWGHSERGPWFYEARCRPIEGGDAEESYLCESRPYRWTGGASGTVEPADRTVDRSGSVDRGTFRRRLEDNDHHITLDWDDDAGRSWRVEYRLRRSLHEAAVVRERGYVRTFEEARTNPVVRQLTARILERARPVETDRADVIPFAELSPGRQFDNFVRLVQGIEYARDFNSIEVYDYNRTVEETLVDGVGDCKDKSYLLAGLLDASPLDCETALLVQPAHILVGVAADDVPSPFDDLATVELGDREWFPVEPSWRVDVGEISNAPIVAAYADGEWIHLDGNAMSQNVDRYVDDLLRGPKQSRSRR